MRLLLLAFALASYSRAQDAEEPPAAPPVAVEESAAEPAAPAVEEAPAPAETAKPEPKLEPKPKAQPAHQAEAKPELKPTAPAVQALSPEDLAAAEWKLLSREGEEGKDEETAQAVLPPLTRLLRSRPEADFAGQAQLLRAELLMRQGDAYSAAMALLRLLNEAPEAKHALQAKRRLNEIAEKKLERKLRPVVLELARGSDLADAPARTARLLARMVEKTGTSFYAPLSAEFEDFFARHPAYAGSDELLLQLGQLNAAQERPRDAQLAYARLLVLHPASALRAKALRMSGDLWAQNLKNYDKAVEAYQAVTTQFAESEEAGVAYEAMARLEEQMKRYDLALDVYEKVVKLYPGTDAALRALNSQARLLVERLERPQEAVQAYERVADMFKETAVAAKALRAAAAVSHKQKDFEGELKLLERLAKECGETPDAPEALYEAAELCEGKLTDNAKAAALYQQLAERYPKHSLGRKAKKRADTLAKKLGAE